MYALASCHQNTRYRAAAKTAWHPGFNTNNQRLLRKILNPEAGAENGTRTCAIQASLKVGAANDSYEQEADRVADQVSNTSDSELLTKQRPTPAAMGIQRMCPGCEEELQQKGAAIQKHQGHSSGYSGAGALQADDEVEQGIRGLNSSGQVMAEQSRAFFEPRFGRDFSQVKVHTGADADRLTTALNARAFTYGNHIVFANGEYQPDTGAGKHLMGHELTHVVQQGAAKQSQAPGGSNNSIQAKAENVIQKAEPVSTVTIGAVAAKCIIGAIAGVLFDGAIQAALHSWKQRSWRFWEVTLNWCSIILSAILGCIAGPISAYMLEPWIAAQLGPKLGGMAGTLIGKILIFIAKKLGMAVPKSLVGSLAKLNCISPEQSAELGVPVETIT